MNRAASEERFVRTIDPGTAAALTLMQPALSGEGAG